jgi:RHS repeat-associated protein
MLNTGTFKYRVPLAVPPGTRGMAPAVAFAYESGNGNGPIGIGWTLPLPYIQRQTDKGIPRYVDNLQNGLDDDFDGQTDEPDEIDRFINELKEELVPQAGGYYFCENEGTFIRYRRNGDHWEGTLPDGTRLRFGISPQGRIEHAGTGRVFCWLLQEQIDTRGNTILYTYTSFTGQQNTNQKYLTGISYGPGPPPWSNFHFVSFAYEDRDDWFEDCRSGFAIRSGKRLHEIVIATQTATLPGHAAGDRNQDGAIDYLTRKYVLNYSTNSHWSLLRQVVPVGANGLSALPPVTFNYTLADAPETLSAIGHITSGLNEPPQVMDNPLVDLLELNGDGIPDILKTERWSGAHLAFINLGESQTNDTRVIRWSAPTEIASSDGLAPNINLESLDTPSHLADMDGDGLADLVHHSAIGSVYYFGNTGRLTWNTRKAMSVLDFAPPSPFGADKNVKTADLDFDKRIDIIQSVPVANGVDYRIWFNRGEQRYSFSQTVSPPRGFNFSQVGVHIADFNGDRVPDVLSIRPTHLIVTPGLGHGNFAPPITIPLPGYTLDSPQLQRTKPQDINGDGLADLVIERAAPGELWYWLNLGNYSLTQPKRIIDLPANFSQHTAIRWADLNGNGTTDLIYADSSASSRLRMIDIGRLLGCVPRPHLLTSINNGIGRVITLTYESSTTFALADAAAGQPWPYPLPFPITVVAAADTSDSLGHTYRTHFKFHDGYYDAAEKEFRGFARVEQIDIGDTTAPTLVSRSAFDVGHTHEAMKGKLLSISAEQEDGDLFLTEQTTWTTPPKVLYTGINGQTVKYAHPLQRIKILHELAQGTQRRIESEFAYDTYGNQTTNAEYGIVVDGDRAAFDDERITVTEFAINLDNWLIRLPARQTTMDENGTLASRVEFFYDDETFAANNAGAVILGNITLRRAWIHPSIPSAFINAARTKYDSYGNPITLLDPLSSGLASGHLRDVVYDSNFHTYPVREIIHLGDAKDPLTIEVDYDPAFGKITASRDFNANQTSYAYDTFGRLINIIRPYDTQQYPTLKYDYALAVPAGSTGLVNYIETRQLGQTNSYFISRAFIDGLGRHLMTKHQAEPDPQSTQPRFVVKEAVQFNARAAVSRVLSPFYSTHLSFEDISAPGWQGAFHQNGQILSLDLTGAHKTQTEYDATLRPIKITNADATFRRTVYQPFITTSYDENDNDPASPHFDTPISYQHDGLGRQIRTEETARLNDDGTPAAELKTWPTQFAYDLNDHLTRITDSQNNVKFMTHDALGRLTFMNDPDRGLMHYEYDAASNLVETRDAKNQRINYTYDGANRILSEHHQDIPKVIYHYDTPAADIALGDGTTATPRNTKGFLAHVQDPSGEEHTSFDNRGRLEYLLKRIADPVHHQLVPFTTRYSYDSADRLTALVYPDNDQVTYQYNKRNLLQCIPGGPSGTIISNITYLASGQKEHIRYGNGVATSYQYDARQRLSRLSTFNPQLSTELIHFSYQFDSANNISAIHDLRPGSAAPAGDPRRNTQLFHYDDLSRLTRVQYSFNLPGDTLRNDGEINYRYDRIGNMLAQTSTIDHQENGLPIANIGEMQSGGTLGRFNRTGRLATDPPGPHALSSIQNRSFPYDSNGNMTDIDGLQCTWDFKDRLIAVENDKMRAEYTYDYTGRRIIKKVAPKSLGETNSASPTSTIYVNKYFEVREHEQPTKYVWDGETRVARVIGSLSPNPRTQRIRIFPGWNLISLAVSSTNTAAQLKKNSMIDELYKWDLQTRAYNLVADSENLPAGIVLWLKATTQATPHLTGNYLDPTNIPLSASSYYPCSGLEVSKTTNAFASDVSLWNFDKAAQAWHLRLSDDHALGDALSGSQDFLSPGQAVFVQPGSAMTLQAPPQHLRIVLYHPDHLRSSILTTDSASQLVEETAFYPFGNPRHSFRFQDSEAHYTFTQNERDKESRLHYFGARYLASSLGRFASCDPINANAMLANPQMQNLYSYALNGPVRYSDPAGLTPIEEVEGSLVLRGEAADVQAFKAMIEREKSVPAFQKALQSIVSDEEDKTVINVSRANALFIDNFANREVDVSDLEKFEVDPKDPWAPSRGELILHVLVEYHTAARTVRLNADIPADRAGHWETGHAEALRKGGAQEQYRRDKGLPGRVATSLGQQRGGQTIATFKYDIGHTVTYVVEGESIQRDTYKDDWRPNQGFGR